MSVAQTQSRLWEGWNLSQALLITPDSGVPGVETSLVGGTEEEGGGEVEEETQRSRQRTNVGTV